MGVRKAAVLVLVLLSLQSAGAFAQERVEGSRARNNVFLELLGNGFVYSLNYERFLGRRFSLRVGGMVLTGTGESEDGQTATALLTIVPVMLNRLVNLSGRHNLEVGAGLDLAYLNVKSDLVGKLSGSGVEFTAKVGYMYFNPDGGFNFRIAYTPIWSEEFSHSFGVGLGYAF